MPIGRSAGSAARPARLQLADQAAERGRLADKAAVAVPCHEVDMHIDHGEAGRPAAAHRGSPSAEIAAMPIGGSNGRNPPAKRFHGGTSTGSARGPNNAASRARRRPALRATSAGGRSAGYSLFLPCRAWLACCQPCCSTATSRRAGQGVGQPGRAPGPGSPRAPAGRRRRGAAAGRAAASQPPRRRRATTASRRVRPRPTDRVRRPRSGQSAAAPPRPLVSASGRGDAVTAATARGR